jgi:ubiquinone/menaquinone biosynthesis C-methylase UbiE
MNQQVFVQSFSGNAAENYQRYFVPSIGAPVADDLIAVAGVQPGERVLDVACGTGVVTRRAAERVGPAGTVCGLDVNPAMLAVARVETPPDMSIDWHEASADSLPFADGSFDVVLCQMGLQFFPGQLAALREMHRVLGAGGRAYITVPGPKPAMFAVMTDALARHIGPNAASFADLVFSLHDVDEMRELMLSAGFTDVDVRARPKTLRLPAPADFLWQYVFSTPVAEAAASAGEHTRETLEREVCDGWQEFVADGTMSLEVSMTVAAASK